MSSHFITVYHIVVARCLTQCQCNMPCSLNAHFPRRTQPRKSRSPSYKKSGELGKSPKHQRMGTTVDNDFKYLQHGHCHILRRTPARQRQLESTACMVSREFEHAPAALGESGVPWVSPERLVSRIRDLAPSCRATAEPERLQLCI